MQNSKMQFKTDLTKRCYEFSLDIIKLTNTLPNKRSAWVITDQIIRLGTSIGANIVEAKSASSRLEFKKFFEISLKSANETKYWLGLLADSELVKKSEIVKLEREINEIANMLAKSVISLKKKL